jgi:TRAP-type C4-dicarboxylate transport system permease small subunit
MSAASQRPGTQIRSQIRTRIGYALFAVYALYVLAAAFAQKTGGSVPFRLGDVGEFVLFFTATVFFVAGFVQADAEAASTTEHGGSLLHALNENAERYAMLVFYVFICAVIVQEVVRRFVLNFSSAWAQETAQYAFIYLGYVGAAFAVKERAHIRFDILLQRMPARLHGWVYLFAELCTLAFACIALYWSLHTIAQLQQFGGTTPVLRVNKTWAEAALPIGFGLMVIRCLQMMWRDWCDIRAGRPVYVGKSMFEE